MSRPSDWQQREQARNPHHSYIVQAPAGSGKTELLTQRMMQLLARVENPEEVVAITFTRKAAAEMGHRLVKRLRDADNVRNAGSVDESTLPEHERTSLELALAVLENDRRRGWNLLQQSSRLRIRTIDSLCSELARQLPILSGLGGGQQIATDADALYRLAAIRTMAAIEDDTDELREDVVRLLNRYDNQYDKLVGLLTGMLANREQWQGHLLDARTETGFDRTGLEASLRFLVETQLEAALENTPGTLLSALPAIFRYALGNRPKDEVQLKALLQATGGLDGDTIELTGSADMLPHWITLINRLLTAEGKNWRKRITVHDGFPGPSGTTGEEKAVRAHWKEAFSTVLDSHRDKEILRDIYSMVLRLPSPGYEDEAWDTLESMMRLLLRAAEEWKLVMAETGQADFSEISARAIQSLGSPIAPSDLALRMDYRISHLLVDEFQDTSNSQIHLLNRLTAGWSEGDGRSLFLVGDPMQSIYRFRKAEVSLFIQAWSGRLFDHIELIPLQLRVNFRSTRPIVDWVNETFPQIMPHRDDPVMGAVTYSSASCKPDASEQGEVHKTIMPVRDDAAEADRVLDVVRQCDTDSQVAILVRSRNHARAILDALDQAKENEPRLRYQAIDFNPLAGTSLVQDLVSLTLALIQPANRLAWLSTLRAPFIGLDLADLDTLVGGKSSEIILDALLSGSVTEGKEPSYALGAGGRRRLQRAVPFLQQALQQRGRQSVRSLVEGTWIRLGGPACVNNQSELDDAATYFSLVESLESENLPIDHDTLELRMKNLYAEPDAEASGKLQIMTIYAAKGLQFDHVILPGLNRSPAGDQSKLLHWFELAGEDRIVLSPMRNSQEKELQRSSGDLIAFISGVEKKRRALEDGRLLYVAATRAVRKLYLFGAIKPSKSGDIKPESASLMGCLWPAIQAEQILLIEQAASELEDAVDRIPDDDPALNLPRVYRRLSEDWQLPPPPASIAITPLDAPESRDYIEFSWAGEDARLTGNLVHHLLQLIADTGRGDWDATGGMASREDWCRQQLFSEGVSHEKAGQIIGRAGKAIENCLASARGRWMLEAHPEACSEYAFTAVLDGQPRNLVLDRTFVDGDTRWIIDYKTSSHGGGDLEGFLNSEMDRYRDQLEQYRTAMSLADDRPIRTALYFPLLDRFCELK